MVENESSARRSRLTPPHRRRLLWHEAPLLSRADREDVVQRIAAECVAAATGVELRLSPGLSPAVAALEGPVKSTRRGLLYA